MSDKITFAVHLLAANNEQWVQVDKLDLEQMLQNWSSEYQPHYTILFMGGAKIIGEM